MSVIRYNERIFTKSFIDKNKFNEMIDVIKRFEEKEKIDLINVYVYPTLILYGYRNLKGKQFGYELICFNDNSEVYMWKINENYYLISYYQNIMTGFESRGFNKFFYK